MIALLAMSGHEIYEGFVELDGLPKLLCFRIVHPGVLRKTLG